MRRAGDAHVDLPRARVAELGELGPGGRPAHDGVINDYDPFASNDFLNRAQFNGHARGAALLAGLDEGAANIVIADEPVIHGDAALSCVADGR